MGRACFWVGVNKRAEILIPEFWGRSFRLVGNKWADSLLSGEKVDGVC